MSFDSISKRVCVPMCVGPMKNARNWLDKTVSDRLKWKIEFEFWCDFKTTFLPHCDNLVWVRWKMPENWLDKTVSDGLSAMTEW